MKKKDCVFNFYSHFLNRFFGNGVCREKSSLIG